MNRFLFAAGLLGVTALSSVSVNAWGLQGHRLVALIASARLTSVAQQNVKWLLPDRSLADVASWADDYRINVWGTAPWHYVNIPQGETYNRDRHCPRQPGIAVGTPADRWRDCAVDRILYTQSVLGDLTADRSDRAVALKFLVHFVGDLHQPFHAVAEEAGGNGVPVVLFGSRTCPSAANPNAGCQLHGVWDSQLIARRQLSDSNYVEELRRLVSVRRLETRAGGTPADWANESVALGYGALVPREGAIDQAYFQRHIGTLDERLALAGLRLASMINGSVKTPPPR